MCAPRRRRLTPGEARLCLTPGAPGGRMLRRRRLAVPVVLSCAPPARLLCQRRPRNAHERCRAVARAGTATSRRLRARRGGDQLGSPDLVDVRRRPDGGAPLEVPALRLRRAQVPRKRPPDLLEGPRLAASLLALQGGRSDLRGGVAHLPQVRKPPRRTPCPRAALGGRGHRLARPGPSDLGRG